VDTNFDCFVCDYKNHPVLQCASSETIERINSSKSTSQFGRGQYLYKMGQESSGFYFLKKGLVRTYAQTDSGKEQTFALKSGGDWMGFREAISGASFNHNAVAVESTEACFVSREILEELVQNDMHFQKDIFCQMAKEWQEAENRMVSLGTKQVHEKLAEILIVLDQAQGSRNEVEIKVTRDVLASLIGTQTETLVRALGDLKARQYIAVEKHRIQILNPIALRSLSHLGSQT